MQLAAETADQASLIHYDALRSLDQKRAAIQSLRQKAQVELDALLPRSVQQKLTPQSLAWLTDLTEGRYRPIAATLAGAPASVITVGGPAIDQPASRPRPVQVLPRRPMGG